MKSKRRGEVSATAWGPVVGLKNNRTGAVWRLSFMEVSLTVCNQIYTERTDWNVFFPSVKSKVP